MTSFQKGFRNLFSSQKALEIYYPYIDKNYSFPFFFTSVYFCLYSFFYKRNPELCKPTRAQIADNKQKTISRHRKTWMDASRKSFKISLLLFGS